MYKKILISVVLIAGAVALLPHTFFNNPKVSPAISGITTTVEKSPEPALPVAPELVSNVPPPDLRAKSVLALDLATGTNLYSKDFDRQSEIASLTKLMTAMVTLDHVNRNEIVTVTNDDVKVVGSNMGLVPDEKITVDNLLKGLLIPSSNDAAQTLARYVGGTEGDFVSMMNQKAEALALSNTHYANPIGFDAPDNYSSALDLSKITQEFLKYDLLSKIVDTKAEDVTSTDGKIIHHLHTSNKLLLENPDVVGVKTGETTGAQGNLIVKINHNLHPVLTIVLNTSDREGDSRKLIDWIYDSYKW